jgi:hypothetical protein
MSTDDSERDAWLKREGARRRRFAQLETLRRAEALLATGDDEVLHQVCLEIRLCLEAITFKKLKFYRKDLPPSATREWRAPQAIKALLALEPDADRNGTVSFGPESAPGVPVGTWSGSVVHRSMRHRRLSELWNAMGRSLHVSLDEGEPTGLPDRAKLTAILDEIRPVAMSHGQFKFRNTISYPCWACKRTTAANEKIVAAERWIKCLHCDAISIVRIEGDGAMFFAPPTLKTDCHGCKTPIEFEESLLTEGLELKCAACGRRHVIRRKWGVDSEG